MNNENKVIYNRMTAEYLENVKNNIKMILKEYQELNLNQIKLKLYQKCIYYTDKVISKVIFILLEENIVFSIDKKSRGRGRKAYKLCQI